MASLTDLFNPGGAEAAKPINSDIYKVSYKEGKNGVYKSIIRFIPNFADPVNKSIIGKSIAYVKNPVTGASMYVDNQKGSAINEAFFKLWGTKIPTYQDVAKKHLSSSDKYYSLVQIIEDEQHPELKGQIKVFQYGKKLWQKIYDEQHPTGYAAPSNPFHPSNGRYFSLVCTAQQDYNNYDQSSFFDYKDPAGNAVPMGMWYLNPVTQKVEIVTENTDPQALMDYLSANSPDLSKYEAQPWTADQAKFVSETIDAVMQFAANGGVATNMQANLQTVNTPVANPVGQLQVNATPVFPGVNMAPAAPAAPTAPVPPMPAASFGNVTIGNTAPVAPSGVVSGIELPNVAPAAPKQSAPAIPAMNIQDICAGL